MKRIGTGKLREQNDRLVYKYLALGKPVTKRELSNKTGLTFATIGNILNGFKEQNIVIEKETVVLKKGRPTVTYILNPEFFHTLSIILARKQEQNFFYYQINNSLFEVIKSNQEIIDLTNIDVLLEKIKQIILSDKKITIIAIGVPSIVFEDIVIESDIIELKNLNLKEEVEKATGIKTVVKNEMNYCAYGFYDKLTDKKDVCYVTFPKQSGPGCGSVINGELLQGHNNIAGEIIYLPIFEFLKHHDQKRINYDENNIALALATLATIINPAYIVITGEALEKINLKLMEEICLQYIPKKFMAKIIYCEDCIDDFFNGIIKYTGQRYLLDE